MDFLKRVLGIYRDFKKPALIVLFLFVLIEILGLIAPYIFGEIINKITSENPSLTQMLLLAGLGFGIQGIRTLIRYEKDKFELDKMIFNAEILAEDLTVQKVLSLSVGQHRSQNSGKLFSVVIEGMHALQTFAFRMLYDVFPKVFQVLITIIALLIMSVSLGSIVLIAGLAFAAITLYLNKHMRDDLREFKDLKDENRKAQNEMLRNLSLIQTNSQERRVREDYVGRLEQFAQTGRALWTWYIKRAYGRHSILEVTEMLVMVMGIIYVARGYYEPGALVVFIMWTHTALAGLKPMGHLHRQFLELSASIKKYFRVLDTKPIVEIVSNPIKPGCFVGEIEFKGVTFTYPDLSYLDKKVERNGSAPAIRDLSFTIEAGERIAFVGRSGAGKSTIISLLLRFYDPEEGQILIDGHDLRLLDLSDYRESIGLVEQSVDLFDHTLRYNMLFGLNGKSEFVTDGDIDHISEVTRISSFSDRLTEGYETLIGENGIQLSGGERQRVGIARALIKNPSILILDEATSNLDAENEALIKSAIDEASEGRTTIIIAHRLSTVIDCDRIFVMEKGQIVEIGSHEELMATAGAYRNLVDRQVQAMF